MGSAPFTVDSEKSTVATINHQLTYSKAEGDGIGDVQSYCDVDQGLDLPPYHPYTIQSDISLNDIWEA